LQNSELTPADRERIVLLIPVFNDWDSLFQLVALLDNQLAGQESHSLFHIVVVDDGSLERPPQDWSSLTLRSIAQIELLELRYNLGHQRALAVGLSYIADKIPAASVVVMDGDGEDDPRDVPRLLAALRQADSPAFVFAERLRRSEGLFFRFFYFCYRVVHHLLTGIPVRVGNFSVIPYELLLRLVPNADLWNHYSASVVHARLPMIKVPTSRGTRLAGRSRMNMVSLFIHGFSAISVFGDRVAMRMLLFSGFLACLIAMAGVAVVTIRLATDWAIPGWATYTMGMLIMILFQLASFLAVFMFVVLGARNRATFLPIRDYSHFVLKCSHVWPRHR
jgi:polyisoprenyl-phosphate glycosyltransferase